MTSAMRAVLAAVLVFSVGAPVGVGVAEAAPYAAAAKAKSKSKTKRKARSTRARPRVDPGFAARDAYYSGKVEESLQLSLAAGERWVAGLAAWRMSDYETAFRSFSAVALDEREDAWLRSGAAFWAARAAVAAGMPEQEQSFLTMAAASPWTFYGMIAEASLGLEPSVGFSTISVSPDVMLAESVDPLARLIRTASVEGAEEMAPIADVQGFNPAHYPVPLLSPEGGFTVDPALVYGLIRQESRFNANAVSPAGAVGLMQLMPSTARLMDARLSNRTLLRDPALNLAAGQAYLNQLASNEVGDDLLLVIAAYNAGPGAVAKTIDRVGWGADPLLLIESLPARETRDYVEKVMANYWIYRRQFGQPTPSLEALARGERVSIAYDNLNPASRVQQASLSNAQVSSAADDFESIDSLPASQPEADTETTASLF